MRGTAAGRADTIVAVSSCRTQVIPGLTMCALKALAGIVQAAGVQLLTMASVYRPLCHLLGSARATAAGVRFNVKSDRGSHDALLLPLVAWDTVGRAAALDAEALVHLVVRLWRCMRRGSTTVPLIDAFCDDSATAAGAGQAAAAPKHRSRFVLLAVLQLFVADPSKLGNAARDCVLSMARSRHPGLVRRLCGPGSLLSMTCHTLGALVMERCGHPLDSSGAEGRGVTGGPQSAAADQRRQPVAQLLALLVFVDDVADVGRADPREWLPHVARGTWEWDGRHNGQPLAASLLPALNVHFLAALRRCLLDGSEEQLTTATCITGVVLRHLARRERHTSMVLLSVVVTLLGPLLGTPTVPRPTTSAPSEGAHASPAARAAAVMAAYRKPAAAAAAPGCTCPRTGDLAATAVFDALLQRVCGYTYVGWHLRVFCCDAGAHHTAGVAVVVQVRAANCQHARLVQRHRIAGQPAGC